MHLSLAITDRFKCCIVMKSLNARLIRVTSDTTKPQLEPSEHRTTTITLKSLLETQHVPVIIKTLAAINIAPRGK